MKIAARRDQAAETILGYMLELDPAGERLVQLLDLIHNPSVERGVGQERFPFGRQVCPKVGHHRLGTVDLIQVRLAHHQPVNLVDPNQIGSAAERHDRDQHPRSALDHEIGHVEP